MLSPTSRILRACLAAVLLSSYSLAAADGVELPNAWTGMDANPEGTREFPTNDKSVPEIWMYTDSMSYAPGDEVKFFVHTTADEFSYIIERDGATRDLVHEAEGVSGQMQNTPENAYNVGAGWEESFRFRIPKDWKSGGYVVRAWAQIPDIGVSRAEHFFVVRAALPGRNTNIALMLSTSTYIAYNDWGGANYYRTRNTDHKQTHMSSQRPWARGFTIIPDEAPRHGQQPRLKPFELPRYRTFEWSLTHGYSRHYSDAGWGYFDGEFARWAEREGFRLEYFTQHDLHFNPDIADAYDVVIIMGHDEYWTWEMRDNLEAFIDQGGYVARFAGNYIWQVRLEDDGDTQLVYKNPQEDPLLGTVDERRVATAWDHPVVNRPPGETLGLTGVAGIYVAHGSAAPRGSRGFTVYRPSHWAFTGTDLYYADVFGHEAGIVSYEVDGVDYTFRDGLPEPTFRDGTPQGVTILAMAPAIKGEEERPNVDRMSNAPLSEFEHLEQSVDSYGDQMEAILETTGDELKPGEGIRSKYGAAVIAVMSRGKGEVFNAGSASWINGLRDGDFYTEQITRNVLRRYSGQE